MFKILSTCKGGGYRYCRTNPPHPRRNAKGLYPLHRVLVENKIGRLLLPTEEVHHKDEDKQNDDPDNLEVKTKVEHAEHHGKTRIVEPVKYQCPCGTRCELPAHIYRQRIDRSKGGMLYCSRACGTRFQRR